VVLNRGRPTRVTLMTTSAPAREPARAPTTPEVLSRIGAALLGSYAFVWGFVTMVAVLGTAGGMPFGDAQTLAYLLAFLVFLASFCWAFAARSVVRVWLVQLLGAAVMSGLGWLASSMML